ncbi:MAG: bifunctional chorismate mutase/prephenate dehydrogenase [Archangium sp.]|nr:bifunctional chorismate mutase/prephenate dehydrogenase [Archangium sp.]
MASAPLKALRDALSSVDRDLITLLGKRMDLVRQVAEIKAASGAPSFDREREGAHLDELLELAMTVRLAPDIVRDLFRSLFSTSRALQRTVFAARAQHFSIGIIGGTAGMGAFLARVFMSAGHAVETMGLGVGAPAAEVASRHDLVVIAVPIADTVEVIKAVAPHVRKGACLIDVTSIKAAPLEAMLAHAPPGVDVVGTHPMFGPSGNDFDRQKVVLCHGRGEAGLERVRRLFEAFGAEIIEASADEHDEHMALIQVLVHEKTLVLGSVLERLGAPLTRSLQFASPIYRTELALIGRMFSQRPELYADILTVNPRSGEVSQRFAEEAKRLADAVSTGQRDALITRFREVASFMENFATWAKKESDAILQDVVRHG